MSVSLIIIVNFSNKFQINEVHLGIFLASRREAPRLYPIGSAWDESPVIVMAYPDFLCIYEG
jgi:hypothetical protein